MNRRNFFNGMIRVLKNINTLLFLVMIIAVLLQIADRHFLPTEFTWTVEASRYLFVIIVFWGTVIAFYEREHIIIKSLLNRLPKRLIPYARLITNLNLAIFIFIALNGGIKMAKVTWNVHAGSLEIFGIKRGYLYGLIIVGMVIFSLVVLNDTIDQIKKILQANINGCHESDGEYR